MKMLSRDSYEKLGLFYLGRQFDLGSQSDTDELLLFEAKDLTTHAVCVGMTGSGKTGLCISLIEEAAIDGIPAIIIDPKGDLGNLMLNFPELRPDDFAPWIDPAEAAREGRSLPEQADAVSEMWRKGLESWGQPPERIRDLRNAVDMTVYTPGSSAGVPLNVLKSFAAPPPALLEDADALRDRVQSTVSGLMALLGIDADPLQSREHILVSNILSDAWSQGRSLDMSSLILAIQNPPFRQLGVFDIDSFFPQKDRMGLAMRLNSVLAAPGFSGWMMGEPLDVQRLLRTEEGKPRLSIMSIAHLSDAERMFFVTLLLNEVLTWMRAQPGTSSLRALLYMDEIYGFFPPSANPPSKKPMLTLLKQARAYGLGCVLSTQNPVDLDYKGLSNTGTWFIGRLQTEQDKARVLDGLEGAASAGGGGVSRAELETMLSGLNKRVFLMNNVHDDAPVLFRTRWTLSYLSGPLTRKQIGDLRKDVPVVEAAAPAAPAAVHTFSPADAAGIKDADAGGKSIRKSNAQLLPPDIQRKYLRITQEPAEGGSVVYKPVLYGSVRMHFVKSTANIDEWRDVFVMAPLPSETGPVEWEAGSCAGSKPEFVARGRAGAVHGDVPQIGCKVKSYTLWKRMLKDHIYQSQAVTIYKSRSPKAVSAPGQSKSEFIDGLALRVREERDLAVEKLKRKYATKFATARDRIRRAEARIERETDQYQASKANTAIRFGTTLLGALFGRKALSVGTIGRAGTALRSTRSISKEKDDIARAQDEYDAQTERLQELEDRFEAESDVLKEKYDVDSLMVEEVCLRPRKSDINVRVFSLLWTPWCVDGGGMAEPLFDCTVQD